MKFRHVWAVTLKELRHIRRDSATLMLVLFSPVLLLFLMAYAITAELRKVPLAVLDFDRSPTSRAFIQQITLGDDLDLVAQVDDMDAIEDLLLRNQIKVAVVIAPTFEGDLLSARGLPIQVIIDGTEPQSGGFALERIGSRTGDFAERVLADHLQTVGLWADSLSLTDLRIRVWYNPSLEAKVDLIPGLLSMVLGMPAMTVALTLAREREHGTLEQLIATPITRGELLLGKMNPYVISGLGHVIMLTAIARVWFQVPFRGDFLTFLILSTTFFFGVLSMGMIIGVFVRTQAASMALSFLIIFFPGFFLTGIFFPISSLPPIVRMESMSLPGSHYAAITRGVFTTGVGWEVLWPYGAALLVMGILFTGVAVLFFRKKLG